MNLDEVSDYGGFCDAEGVQFNLNIFFLKPVHKLCYLCLVELDFSHGAFTHQIASNDDMWFCAKAGVICDMGCHW